MKKNVQCANVIHAIVTDQTTKKNIGKYGATDNLNIIEFSNV